MTSVAADPRSPPAPRAEGLAAPSSPPTDRPRLVVRVGVTGHRPGRLAAGDPVQLAARVAEVLREVAAVAGAVRDAAPDDYAPAPACVRVISSIAEGADQIVADAALRMGAELQCPLPFVAEEYAKDFADGPARAAYDRLRAAATAVFELDGTRDEPEAAYERAGRAMLRHSDVVIAVWDGDDRGGRGGTWQTVREALTLAIPVLWIRAAAPHACALLRSASAADDARDDAWQAPLAERLRQALAPARPDPRGTDGMMRAEFFAARRAAGAGPARRSDVVDELPPDFALADGLATKYGRYYRRAFVSNYAAAAFAVFFALIAGLFHRAWGSAVEFLLMSGILWITWRGQARRWHDRWLRYRLLGEVGRQVRMLHPIGRVMPAFRVPPYATDADPSNLWVHWLFRARLREMGLPRTRLTPATLDRYRGALHATLEDQIGFHERAAVRSRRRHEWLHHGGEALFAITFVICCVHVIGPRFARGASGAEGEGGGTLELGALAAAAFLPALGAAAAAIASQGDYAGIERRAEAMAERLRALGRRLGDAAGPVSSDRAGGVAEEASELMTAELLDWQVTFRAKPLTLPA